MFIPTELYTKANIDVTEDLEKPDPSPEVAQATLLQCSKCGSKGQLTKYVKSCKVYLCQQCIEDE